MALVAGEGLCVTFTYSIIVGIVCVFSALVLGRPNGHLLSPELSSSFGSGTGSSVGGTTNTVIRTGLYHPRSTASSALHYAHSTPRVNAGDLTQPSLQAGPSREICS